MLANDTLLAALVDDMRREHHAHTIVLYGSHARGDATLESDVDVAVFADVAETTRDARLWNGMYLDGFVYPTSVIEGGVVDADMLKLLGGRVLADDRQLASGLFERLVELERKGPAVLAEPEKRMRRVWARKMLARIQRDDLEARYRLHWLLYQLLEDYFALRDEWYLGPKLALAALAKTSPATYHAFEAALAHAAPHETLVALVDAVVGSEA